jgi:hypothetical protein
MPIRRQINHAVQKNVARVRLELMAAFEDGQATSRCLENQLAAAHRRSNKGRRVLIVTAIGVRGALGVYGGLGTAERMR